MTEAHSKVCHCGGFNESCYYCGGGGIVSATEELPRTSEVVGDWVPVTEPSSPLCTYHREPSSAYAVDKASYITARQSLTAVIKQSMNGSEKAYALAATNALELIKAGKNRCHFEDLLPSWKRLLNEVYYHDKQASKLLKEHSERKSQKSPPPTHSKQVRSRPTIPKQPIRPATLMELRLRELGLVREM